MNSGMKMLFGIAAGTFLLGMAIPFAWADGGAAAMQWVWLGTACRIMEA